MAGIWIISPVGFCFDVEPDGFRNVDADQWQYHEYWQAFLSELWGCSSPSLRLKAESLISDVISKQLLA